MRKLMILSALALAACQPPAAPPVTPREGAIITQVDPRDTDQCTAQPDLAWCKAACDAAPRSWCKPERKCESYMIGRIPAMRCSDD